MFKREVPAIHSVLIDRIPQFFVALFVLLLFIASAYGQTAAAPSTATPPAADQSATPTVISNVDEVTLDLIIHNKKNKPVLDLKPEDLNVTDNGTPVKLRDLRLVSGNSASACRVTFFYDQLSNSSATNARNISDKILKLFPNEGFYFSVLNFQRRLRLYQEYTGNRDDLKKAIYSATEVRMPGSKEDDAALPEKNLLAITSTGADLSGANVSLTDREAAQVMLQSLKESQDLIPDHNVLPSLTGLLALTKTQRQLKGRKAIVYFVQGYDVKANAMDTIRSIVGAASRSGISVYVVDVNAVNQQVDQGLMSQMVMGSFNSSLNQGQQVTTPRGFGASNTGAAPSGPPAATPGVTVENGASFGAPTAPASGVGVDTYGMAQAERFQFQDARMANPMARLAASTGGAAMLAGENPKKLLQQLQEDLTTYYEASYVPPNQDYDGHFRPVSVQPASKNLKDLRIRTRAGYFALPPGGDSAIRPFEAPLLKALSGQELPNDLKFHAGVLRLGNLPDGNANTLVVEVPLTNLDMKEDHNTNLYSLHLSIVTQVKNKAGVIVEHFSQDVPQRGALETKDNARAQVITMQRHFSAVPGQYVLEAAIMDQNSGKLSAQRIDFEIPNPGNGPTLSDLALVRKTLPFDSDSDPLEPLRYENSKVVPSLSGDVSRDTKNISLFFLIHPDSDINESPTLDMEVLRNGEPIGRVPLQLHKTTGSGAVPYMTSIQASVLPPGNYELTATLSQGEKTGVSSISFSIPGSEVASAALPATATPINLANSNDPELVAYSKFSASAIGSNQNARLIFTPVTETTSRPTADQVESIIAKTRERALHYSVSLPNFTCVEITDRSLDPSGDGKWRHKDSIAELLRFVNNEETRTTLSINGQRSSVDRENMDPEAAISRGEFGKFLTVVFKPESKTDFQWKETDTLEGNAVQVFSYHIAKENSPLVLTGENNRQEVAAVHGLVYIDDSTMGVRRITLEAENLPQNFSIHSTSIAVNYNYVSINNHDYLMPISGTLGLTRGKHQADMNEMEFRDYKRYGSQTKISFGGQSHP